MRRATGTSRVLLTTPIFYVNAKPHIGHLYTAVLADYFKRVYELLGYTPILSTGTDEHGMKVYNAAFKAGFGTHTLGFCDQNSKAFQTMMDSAGVSYDIFTRTTDAKHKVAVANFWQNLASHGAIFKGKHKGFYSSVEEAFIPSNEVMFNFTAKRHTHAKTGAVLEEVEEENYLFPIGKFKNKLKELYHVDGTGKIKIPDKFRTQIMTELNSLPNELSISRPTSRSSWGILVPNDPSQTIYVWLDALVNYYTALGYPDTAPEKFPSMVHLVGKDIIRFHSLLWPALLTANDCPPPAQILVHNFWLMDNVKMSKSLGNVVPAETVLLKYGQNATRFYLLKEGPYERDETFTEGKIPALYNAHAVNEFANSLSRITSSKIISRSTTGSFTVAQDPSEKDLTFAEWFNTALKQVYSEGNQATPAQNIDLIIKLLQGLNKYINDTSFWNKPPEEASVTLGTIYEALKSVCVLLYPIMPQYATKTEQFFKIGAAGPENKRKMDSCGIKVHKGKMISFEPAAKKYGFIKRIKA